MSGGLEKPLNRTQDGFICHADGSVENGLATAGATTSSSILGDTCFDVIIIGAGFAGLIAAREVSLRNQSVLLIDARDRIGGRTFTAEHQDQKFEMGGAWVHWSQPHVWSEITRYGLSIAETKGIESDHVTLLLDNGSVSKNMSMKDIGSQLVEIFNNYSNVDGLLGRTVFPLPYEPFAAAEAIRTYDKLSMQDRLDQVLTRSDDNKEYYQLMDAMLCADAQSKLSESGFIDYLRWWALGDHDVDRLADKTVRYKIAEGTSALAKAMLNDCRDIKLLLSTPVTSVNRSDDKTVTVCTKNSQLFTARAVIVTIPLNVLHNIGFSPPLKLDKQRAIDEGQCRGGIKFTVQLESPVGDWIFFAAHPNPLTVGFTDDKEGTTLVVFGVGDSIDIRDINVVQAELRKFLPTIAVKCVIGHNWREDPFVAGTWCRFKPGQVSSDLQALQAHEPPLFFASSDSASGWRGFIDGAFESGLTAVRQVETYLKSH